MTEHTPGLPATLAWRTDGDVGVLELARPEKHNALDNETVLGLERFFTSVPDGVRAVVLAAQGRNFCAGLDLTTMDHSGVFEGVLHSRMWHRVMSTIIDAPVPVFSVLKGAVIGGGLELASATHVRVAERSTFYALPEGQHGLFVGGGASVRVPRLIGAARMTDMMLTGRRYDAVEGERVGLSQYVVDNGTGLDRALELAHRAAANSPVTNYAILQVLPRTAEVAPHDAYLIESLVAGIASGSDEAKGRMRSFLDKEKAGRP
ncbi:crotonase/enoyl-CoA hydratase family protein [Ornithinimicrobium sp. LYQ121]|uniref:crotonase/enoyl-CoA hydratase family protein n=1 Tax=Ornithinimicrobium sp. LYQ121 TaxID=3378801 RepID=UPI0038547D05